MTRPAVLLVPGGSASCATYFQPLHALSEVATVVHHDRIGTGTHPRRGPVSLAEQAADLHAALQAADAGPAVVVAHSYGGPVTLQLALDFPDAVHSVVLLDPTPLTTPKDLTKLVKTVNVLAAVAKLPGAKKGFAKAAMAKVRKEGKAFPWTDETEAVFAWTHDTQEIPRLAALLQGFPEDAALLVRRLTEAGGLNSLGVIVTADRKPDHKLAVLHEALRVLTGLPVTSWEGTTHVLHGQRTDLLLDVVRAELGAIVP